MINAVQFTSWFHGDISSQEAEELLQGEGSFLFRLSSKPRCLAISYILDGVPTHSVIDIEANGVKYDSILTLSHFDNK